MGLYPERNTWEHMRACGDVESKAVISAVPVDA
jgi:hypothetical protein